MRILRDFMWLNEDRLSQNGVMGYDIPSGCCDVMCLFWCFSLQYLRRWPHRLLLNPLNWITFNRSSLYIVLYDILLNAKAGEQFLILWTTESSRGDAGRHRPVPTTFLGLMMVRAGQLGVVFSCNDVISTRIWRNEHQLIHVNSSLCLCPKQC